MKLIRKLVLGCVTVGFLATTLAATTYAWYKLGNAAFAESFEFNASTTEGFLVSIDGVTYKHKLSTEDMIKAMVVGKNPTRFVFNDDGQLVDTGSNGLILEGNNLSLVYQNLIALEPVTSKDGKTIQNLSRSIVNEKGETSSKYVYFELYFKTIAETADENKSYDIYLDGLGYDDEHVNSPATGVWSNKATNVSLVASMTTYNKTYVKGDTVQVYTSNASRFSVQDLGFLTEQTIEEPIYDEEDPTKVVDTRITTINTTTKPNGSAIIYELSEDSQYDLGSYATDYNGDDEKLSKLYNCNHNAMYTYYNNVKTEDTLENKLPHFDTDLPQTIRSLTTFNENGVKINTKEVIATVKSGEVTKVAFRFWIEGWDGDCFDGLPGYYDVSYEQIEANASFDVNKAYYTRSGLGTEENPYIYVKAVITEFEDGVTYYIVSGTEVKEVNPINVRLLFNSI